MKIKIVVLLILIICSYPLYVIVDMWSTSAGQFLGPMPDQIEIYYWSGIIARICFFSIYAIVISMVFLKNIRHFLSLAVALILLSGIITNIYVEKSYTDYYIGYYSDFTTQKWVKNEDYRYLMLDSLKEKYKNFESSY